MSNATKLLIGLVVLVLILGGVFWWYHGKQANERAAIAPGEDTSLPSGSATTDQALAQDLSSIDSQLQASQNDTASASASVDSAVASQ